MSLVVDAHQHFLDPDHIRYPWLSPDQAVLWRRLGPGEIRPLLHAAGVDRTVVIQAVSDPRESLRLLAMAADTDFVAGVVGWVDLASPEVAQELDQLRSARGGELLVGVRHQVEDAPDPAWLAKPEVRRGLSHVAQAGLTYDLLLRHDQLPTAVDVVRSLPEATFVLDHLGKPDIGSGKLEPAWSEGVQSLAEQPNVMCKLSGMVTQVDRRRWDPADLVPCVQATLSWFGPKRCLFGSDWPVCLLGGTYQEVREALEVALGPQEPEVHAQVFGANAVRAYRLETRP